MFFRYGKIEPIKQSAALQKEDIMKNSIGSSIKTLAFALALLILVGAIVYGVILIGDLPLMGIIVIAGGILLAVVVYYVLTGFGQLVENSDIIAERYRHENESKQRKQEERQKKAERKKLTDGSVPEMEFIEFDCPFCGENLSFTKADLADGSVICPYCEKPVDVDAALR